MAEAINFKKLFEPRSIAVVGVSSDVTKGASIFLNSLITLGFPGAIYPVNNKLNEVMGLETYPSVSSIPYPVDYAIIGVPAAAVPGVVDDCARKGVPFVQIFTSGFEELGTAEGTALQQRIKQKGKGRTRIIGPNCMGIYHPKTRIGFEPEQSVRPGDVGFISQSGGLAMNFVDRSVSEKIFVSKLISIGNVCDLCLTDFLDYFRQDPETQVIGTYLEGLQQNEHRKFFALARTVTQTKPLVMWKPGYTEAGARAARSHTGSMVGTYRIWRSLSTQAGIIMVQSMEELVDVISIYVRSPLPKGLQVSIVAYGGGTNVTATDACTSQGLKLPILETEIQQKMLAFIPEAGTFRSNPVDVTGWVTSPRIAGGVSLLAACDPQIHALIFILDIDFIFKQCNRLNLDLERLFGGHSKSLLRIKEETGKPVVCVLQKTGDVLALEDARLKAKNRFLDIGIPCFPDIARAAKALAHLNAYRLYRDHSRFKPLETPESRID